jgi:aldose 1-epimerase
MSSVLVLSSEGAVVRLLPHAGGRVSSLKLMSPTWGAVDVLHPYPEDVFDPIHWAKGGIYPLMPYSNRIADAKVRVGDEVLSLLAHPCMATHTLNLGQPLPHQKLLPRLNCKVRRVWLGHGGTALLNHLS